MMKSVLQTMKQQNIFFLESYYESSSFSEVSDINTNRLNAFETWILATGVWELWDDVILSCWVTGSLV